MTTTWPNKSVLGKDESVNDARAAPYNLSLAGGWVQDIAVTSPTNGDMLVYDTLAEKWTNTPTNVKSLRIRTDSLVFKTSTTGAVTPDFIMLEALKANVTGTVAWACSVPLYDSATGGAVTTTGDIVYLRKANMGALATLAITAAIAAEAVSDKVMIAALVDGGEALTVLLYNSTHGLNTTSAGVVTYAGSGTSIMVYEGSTPLTITGCTAAPTGITLSGTAIANIGTTAVTVADHIGIAADNGRVKYTLTVTRLNGKSATVYGTQSLYKAWQGAMGSSAAGFSISASALVFSRNSANVITSPAYIKITSKEANVSGNVTWSTSPSVILWTAATGGTIVTQGTIAYLRLSDMGTNTEVAVTATHSAGMTDSLTIVTVRAGTHGITTVLSNPAHSLPTNYADTVTYTGSGTTIRVYEGATLRPITACVATGTGITACAPAGISGLGTSTVTVGMHNTITAPTASVEYAITYTGADGATGLTTTATQTLVKSLQGVTGNPGTRGSVTRYLTHIAHAGEPVPPVDWSSEDLAAVLAALPSTPITGDTAVITNGSTFTLTKVYTAGGVWAAPGTVIDGNLIVTNSITASQINTYGLTIKDAAGHDRVALSTYGVSLRDNANNVRVSFDSAGQIQIFNRYGAEKIGLTSAGDINLSGDILLGGGNVYRGVDNLYASFGGGSTNAAYANGGSIQVYGNTSGYAGRTSIYSGNAGGAFASIQMGSTNDPSYANRIQLTPNSAGTGLVYVSGNFQVSGGTLTLPAASVSPAAIAQDSSNRFATDAEKTAWNAKSTLALGSTAGAALGTAAAGSATTAAKSDHVHAMPTAANVGAMSTSHAANSITGFGNSATALGTSAAGSATTVSRSDHVHALTTTFTSNITVPGLYVGANTTLYNGGVAVFLEVQPKTDNTNPCGKSTFRWSTVYAATGTINTSDAREKTAVRALAEAELSAAKDLSREIGAFRFLSAVAAKGDAAREHIGMTVQRAIAIMQSHGLDPFGYSFICYDEWPATEAQVNEHGNVTEPAMPAGNRYSFRPDGLLLFIARGLEARLTQLEERL